MKQSQQQSPRHVGLFCLMAEGSDRFFTLKSEGWSVLFCVFSCLCKQKVHSAAYSFYGFQNTIFGTIFKAVLSLFDPPAQTYDIQYIYIYIYGGTFYAFFNSDSKGWKGGRERG